MSGAQAQSQTGAGEIVDVASEADTIERRGISLTVTLAVSLGLLVLLSVAVVLFIGLWSAQRNTLSLLSDKAGLTIDSAVTRIEQHLMPASDQAAFIAGLVENGTIDVSDRKRFQDYLLGAMAAAPQIEVFSFIDTDYQLIGVLRRNGKATPYVADYREDQAVIDAIFALRASRSAEWAAPIWRKILETTLINFRQPVYQDGEFRGMLVGLVSINALSEYLANLNELVGHNAFILYDRNFVMAHAQLAGQFAELSVERPLPTLADFGDPVLASIWQTEQRFPLILTLPDDTSGHVVESGGELFVFLFRELRGFTDKHIVVGTYFRNDEVNEELRRLQIAVAVGLLAVVLACVAAVILARLIARPIIRLSVAAARIGELAIGNVGALPLSPFRELNQQAGAFNSMLRALRWFEIYVPKTLVERLIRRGDEGAIQSSEHDITVIFTDIAGFTPFAEGKPADEVAAFLNEHFAMIAKHVEAEDGTVDKFIGDAVMAFWGAPEPQEDHAARACRAARAIAVDLRADNEKRRRNGEPTVHLRIGLHSGPATVGNIGAPGRMNYTAVGDTVNVSQRLEQLSKRLYEKGDEVNILISDVTHDRAGPAFPTEPAGQFELPGRSEKITVFRLLES